MKIGTVVSYTLTADDAASVNRRRATSSLSRLAHRVTDGVQLHVGNPAAAGGSYPMVIVRVWGEDDTAAVNGQVILDGTDTLWVTSVKAGEGPGYFTDA